MKKFLLLLLGLIVLVNCFWFLYIENYFIDTGWSWTFSKILPYLFLVIEGVLLAGISFQLFNFRNKKLRLFLSTFLFLAPFLLGFSLHPIYEGDFSMNGKKIENAQKISNISKYDLIVITIPGCPFCLGSVEKINKLQSRNPFLSICYVVCGENKSAMNEYLSIENKSFDLQLANPSDSLPQLADFKFPAFVRLKNGVPIEIWSNDQFGVRALDLVEKEL